mgnify:CR=1 FL=1
MNVDLPQADREQFNALFQNEAKAAGSLSHPYIVTTFDAGTSEQGAYIAMELLRGKDGKFSTANLPGSWGRMIGESSIAGVGAPEWMVTDEEKKFRRLMNDISTAILRKESGATIGVDEFKRELYKYIPLPNDSPEELARKMESLRISSRALAEGTGRAPTVYPNLFGRQPAPSAPVTATAPGGGQMALPAGTPIYDMAGKRVR